jgi:Fe2+ or Zn2+ uptake regulation protein
MGKVREAILKVLENEDLSAREIAEKVRKLTGMVASIPQVYNELYILEGRGEIERKRWLGYWVWGKKVVE